MVNRYTLLNTGRDCVKCLPRVLLGFLSRNTLPVTEKRTPEGSVTDTLSRMLSYLRIQNLLHFRISSKSAMTSAGEVCSCFASLGMKSACGIMLPKRDVELPS